jgi:hypothetical protein
MNTNQPNTNLNPALTPTTSANPTGSAATATPPVITSLADKPASKTKVSVETRYQTLIEGILANFGHVSSFELSTGNYTLDALVSTLRRRIAAAEDTKSTKTDWHTTVQAERQVDGEVRPLRKQLQQYVAARFGATSAKMAEFGFTPLKPRKPTTRTKAAAADKSLATRKARGTMGAKQRKRIKAQPAAANATSPTTTSPAATSPASTAPPSPTASAK